MARGVFRTARGQRRTPHDEEEGIGGGGQPPARQRRAAAAATAADADAAPTPPPAAPPRAARFASPELQQQRRTGQLRALFHSLGMQMRMTPLSSTATSADSPTTASELDTGTLGDGSSTAGPDVDTFWGEPAAIERTWTRLSKKTDGNCSALPASLSDLESGTNSRRARRKRSRSRPADDDDAAPPAPSGPISFVVVENSFDSFVPDAETGDEKHRDSASLAGADGRSLDDADVHSGYTSYLNSDSSSRLRMRRRRRLSHACDWAMSTVVIPLRHYVDSSFPDPRAEAAFKKEEWYAGKHGALIAAIFLLIHYVFTVAIQTGTMSAFKYYAYLGICGFWTIPLPLMVLFNGPRRFKLIYHIWVAGACWCWGWVWSVEMYICGFFGPNAQCGDRNFLQLFAALFANASIAVMSLGQNRLVHILLATAWFIAGSTLFSKQPRFRLGNWRNLVVFELFHLFLTVVAYFSERSDRQLFMLRGQLKNQFRAVQAAQVQERRAEDSKKRFVSYIFHEVRVPLNTARLALANLDGEGAFHLLGLDQKELVIGLDGSLRMMEKVLNDVLSFNRMESGNLIQSRMPFNLHKAVHYVALSHRASAEVTGLDFELELDPHIEEIGGTVIGDEMRFKQVCSNLVSNAFKFTPSGSVRVVTKLLYPVLPAAERHVEPIGQHHAQDEGGDVAAGSAEGAAEPRVGGPESSEIGLTTPSPLSSPKPSTKRVSIETKARISYDFADPHKPVIQSTPAPPPEPAVAPPPSAAPQPTPVEGTVPPHARKALIRVEVHDTGVGLSLSDVRDNRLFSPYVQTEIGRRQGGKGSGLGLALVMQIVKLSRGRLGVDSELGKGSVFWFEIPYTLPLHTTPQPQHAPHWLSEDRGRLSTATTATSSASPSGSISISIARGGSQRRLDRERNSNAASDASGSVATLTAATAAMAAGGAGGAGRLRPGSPLAQSALAAEPVTFNLVPFSSPPLRSLTPSVTEHSPMTRTTTLIPDASEIRPPQGTEGAADRVASLEPSVPRGLGIRGAAALADGAVPPGALRPGLVVHQSLMGRTPSLVPHFNPPPTTPLTPAAPPRPAAAPTPEGPSAILLQHEPELEAPAPLLPCEPLASIPPRRAPQPATRPLSVLVVDDDALTRKLMSRMITRMGHTVVQAENGKVALASVLQHLRADDPVDIIFLDNQMPLMTGVEVTRALRSKGVDTYIVGCTGNALRDDQDEYMRAGTDQIITKPVSPKAISWALEEARKRKDVQASAAAAAAAAEKSAVADLEKSAAVDAEKSAAAVAEKSAVADLEKLAAADAEKSAAVDPVLGPRLGRDSGPRPQRTDTESTVWPRKAKGDER